MRYSDPRSSMVRRNAALARPELRGAPPFIKVSDRLPEAGQPCAGFVMDRAGTYRLPFPVAYREGAWINCRHERPLAVQVVGWLLWAS